MSISHSQIETNGIRLHVADAGPEDGELIILLHGFPEYWGAWKPHMKRLANAGYRVIAPDQRGYNTSDKPEKVSDYRLDTLALDVVGLVDTFGHDKASVVGHDWGGAVTWHLAAAYPERFRKAVVLNCCPGKVLQQAFIRHPGQLLKSWYMFAMQLPWLPEWYIGRNQFAGFADGLVGTSQPETFSAEDLAGYKEAWSQQNAMKSMINWYRAALRSGPSSTKPITIPSLLIWGEQDRFLGTHLIEPTMALCDEGTVIRIPDATHWVNHEEVERVCGEILKFLDLQRPT